MIGELFGPETGKINYRLMLNVETIDKSFFVSTFLIKSYSFDIG